MLILALAVGQINAQDVRPVQGKVYEGNLQGMAILTFDFKTDGNAIFTASAFGEKEHKNVTYEQDGSKITVHAQNGDMILNQNSNDELTLNLNGNIVRFTCQSANDSNEKISEVCNHVFSGEFGNGGRLTLSFYENGMASVSINTNGSKQIEDWPYHQDGDIVTLTEPLGEKFL